MGRRQLIWLLMAGAACALYVQYQARSDFHLQILLRPNRDSQKAFELLLDQPHGAEMHYRVSGTNIKVSEGRLAVDQGQLLQEQLDEAGLWRLTDGDSKEPEKSVFYTDCLARRGTLNRVTHWRGLPEGQARVARIFFEHPHFSQWTRQATTWCASQK